MEPEQLLTVYLVKGNTFQFRNVDLQFAGGEYLEFTYKSASRPGKRAAARFNLDVIAGYSVGEA